MEVFSIVTYLLATSRALVFAVHVSGAQNFMITFHHLLRMNQDKLCQVLTPVFHDFFLGQI